MQQMKIKVLRNKNITEYYGKNVRLHRGLFIEKLYY